MKVPGNGSLGRWVVGFVLLLITTLVTVVLSDVGRNSASIPVLKERVATLEREVQELNTVPGDLQRIEAKLDMLIDESRRNRR